MLDEAALCNKGEEEEDEGEREHSAFKTCEFFPTPLRADKDKGGISVSMMIDVARQISLTLSLSLFFLPVAMYCRKALSLSQPPRTLNI
jgi:hypothetical protein